MNVTAWLAVLVVIVMVWALVKRYETRLVLITAGIVLAMLTLKPMDALDAFAKSMTNAGLIEAICSAMGFAFVISYTRCDEHLVTLLSKPLGRLGLFLVPASAAVTFFVNTAIPSAAGCAAAVGATLIPLMMRSGIHPAGAAAAVLVGTYGSMLSPGMSHNVFVAKIAKMDIMALIAHHAPFSAAMMGIGLVGVTIACFLYKDHRAVAVGAIGADVAGAAVAGAEAKPAAITQANALYALAPFVPLDAAGRRQRVGAGAQDGRATGDDHRRRLRAGGHPRVAGEDDQRVLQRHGQGLWRRDRHHHRRRRVRRRPRRPRASSTSSSTHSSTRTRSRAGAARSARS